jgi:hypothetical protein
MNQRKLYKNLEFAAYELASNLLTYSVGNPTDEVRSVYAHSLYVISVGDAIRDFLLILDYD